MIKSYISLTFAFVAIIFALGSSPVLAQTSISSEGELSNTSPKWAAQINLQQQDLLFQIDVGELGVLHDVKFRPRYALDVQYFYKEKARGRSFAFGQLSYFNNLYHDRWMGIKLGMGFEWEFSKRFFGSIRGGFGVSRVKSSDIQYRYEDGAWVQTKNEERANVDYILTPRIDIGYRISDKAIPIDIVANSHLTIDVNTRVGIIPFYGVGLGLRVGF